MVPGQAIGATTPAFTALLAIVIIGRYERLITYITLVPVILGIVIASKGEPGFHIVGFLLSMTATAARGAKSVMQQVRAPSVFKLVEVPAVLEPAPVPAI